MSARLGLAGWPAAAEEAIIARDVLLAAHVGSRLHVCHVSTAGSVEILRWAKSKGWQVTAEVTPHHLLLTDDLAASYDPVFKVNPPLRTAADVDGAARGPGRRHHRLRRHRPRAARRSRTRRPSGARRSPGMLGLQTALSIVVETMLGPVCSTGAGSPTGCRSRPARDRRPVRPRAADRGRRAGQPGADRSGRAVDGDAVRRWRRSRATRPYAGRTLPGRVVATFLRGRVTCSTAR